MLQLDKKSAIMKAQKRLLVNYIKNEAPYVLMDTPRKKTVKNMANFIFGLTAIIVLIGLAVGLFRVISDRFFSFYGGIVGTVIAYLINAFEFCFLAWLLGWLMLKLHLNFLFIYGGVDWKLGLILGPIYTTFCWITGKENLGLRILRNDWP